MGLFYFIFALAALIVTQTYAGDRIGENIVQDLITNLKEVKDQVQDEVEKMQDTFKSNLDNSRSILSDTVDSHINDATKKLGSMNCAHGTEMALRGTQLQVSANFLACINFTKSIADVQQLGYDLLQFAVSIEQSVLTILGKIEECYIQSFFEAAKCVIYTLETYSANYTDISQQFIVYINRTEHLSEDMVNEFKICLGLAQTFSSNTISNILKTNCETTEINRLSPIKGKI